MFCFLSNILALPCYPVGLAVVLLIAALVFVAARRLKTGVALVFITTVELYVFSTGPLSWNLVRSLEKQYSPVATFPSQASIVLLTGGEVPRIPPRIYDGVNAAGDRILYTARLYRQGVAPRIIVTGGNIEFLRPDVGPEAEAGERLLTGLFGIDSAHILLETKARNTYENALYTRRLIDSLHLPRRVILVTSAIHMPRSVALFRKSGLTVFPAPANYLVDYPPLDVPWQGKLISLLPNAAALANSTIALHEWYGIVAYKLLGRL